MEYSEAVEQRLGQAPALATVEKDIDDQRQIYRLLGFELNTLRPEHAFPQRPEGARRAVK